MSKTNDAVLKGLSRIAELKVENQRLRDEIARQSRRIAQLEDLCNLQPGMIDEDNETCD